MTTILNHEFWVEIANKLTKWVITELPSIFIVTLLLFVFLRLIKIFTRRLNILLVNRAKRQVEGDAFEAEKRINTLTGILKGLGKIFIWTTFLMLIVRKFGVDIAPILAGAGIIGLAVGFGAQELVRDFISGFFILLENQIRSGDVAIINGTAGLVEKIELRTTTIRDISGVVHIFQNGKINSLSNMTKEWSAISFEIGVAYKENLDKVIEIMHQAGNELKEDAAFADIILEPIEVFGLDGFSENALVIKARLKTKPNNQWTVGREFRRRLKIAFDANGIEFPFPQTTISFADPNKTENLKIVNNNT